MSWNYGQICGFDCFGYKWFAFWIPVAQLTRCWWFSAKEALFWLHLCTLIHWRHLMTQVFSGPMRDVYEWLVSVEAVWPESVCIWVNSVGMPCASRDLRAASSSCVQGDASLSASTWRWYVWTVRWGGGERGAGSIWKQSYQVLSNPFYNSTIFLPNPLKTPHSSPMRASYGVAFMSWTSDVSFISATAMLYTTPP